MAASEGMRIRLPLCVGIVTACGVFAVGTLSLPSDPFWWHWVVLVAGSIALGTVAAIPFTRHSAPPEREVEELGVGLCGVPELPRHYLPRPEDLEPLKEKLLGGSGRPVAVTGAASGVSSHSAVALRGRGGVGKSVLAAALARVPDVGAKFADGIVWVTLGQRPNLTARQAQVCDFFADAPSGFGDVEAGRSHLEKLLRDRACLLILDDVWRAHHAEAFRALGPDARMLVTTRDHRVVELLGAEEHCVERVSDEQALELLALWSGSAREDLPDAARDVAEECDNLPLALACVGSMVRDRPDRWPDALGRLRGADLEKIERRFPGYAYPDLLRAIGVGVEDLEGEVRARYLDFAVFPEDIPVPEAALHTLWAADGVGEADVRDTLERLEDRSLLRRDERGRVLLHDLQNDYVGNEGVREELGAGTLAEVHNRLLDAYALQCHDGWADGPEDGYFFGHLVAHLAAAGWHDELCDLLTDLRWLEAKAERRMAFDLPVEYARALAALPADEPRRDMLELLREALRRDLHFVADHPEALFQCLWNSAWWYDCSEAARHHVPVEARDAPWERDGPKLHELLERWREEKEGREPPFAWLRSLRPPPTPVGAGQAAVLRGHDWEVTSVAFSPDGRTVASGSDDRTVRLWDAETGECRRVLEGHEGAVVSVAFNPDGRTVASGSNDKAVRLWDPESGECRRVLEGHEGYGLSVAFSPDGQTVASGSWDNTVRLWDAETGDCRRVLQGHDDHVLSLAFSPDGQTVASGSWDTTVRLWDAETGQCRRVLEGHENLVMSVAFRPDGRTVASGSGDNMVRLWDAETGECRCVLKGHDGWVLSVAFGPEGRTVASASDDGTVRLWDAESNECRRVLEGHEGRVRSVAFSADGRTVASGSYDRTVRLWDAGSGECRRVLEGHENLVMSVAFRPDGGTVASGSADRTVRLWDAETGQCRRVLEGHDGSVVSVAFSPGGRTVASGSDDRTVRLWDTETGECRRVLEGHESWVNSVALSPDGRTVASGSADRTVRLWDAETGECRRVLEGHEDWVRSVAFSLDGQTVASGSDDKTVRLWDARTGQCRRVLEGHEDYVESVAFSPDGRTVASGSFDSTVRLWDAKTGKCLEVVKGGWDANEFVGRADPGDEAVRLRAVARGGETVVLEAGTQEEVAHFPTALDVLARHPSQLVWAGARFGGNHLYTIALEGTAWQRDG